MQPGDPHLSSLSGKDATERGLQALIDAVPDALIIVDRNRRVTAANRAAREAAGEQDPVGRECAGICRKRSSQRPGEVEGPCSLDEVLARRASFRSTHTRLDEERGELIVEVRAAPLFDAAGEVTHVIETWHEVPKGKPVC
ncbi:MAG: PAS domain-containing protein [Planctomycetota bacterium]